MTAAAAPAAGAARQPFPFRHLFRVLVGERGMHPSAFWRLSVPEVAMFLGLGEGAGRDVPTAADLSRLMERFPDERG